MPQGDVFLPVAIMGHSNSVTEANSIASSQWSPGEVLGNYYNTASSQYPAIVDCIIYQARGM